MFITVPSELNYIPKRIISLVPSQTELLAYLGLEKETIGITKFCVHPEAWFRTKTRIGGTKTVDIEKVNSLSPDLILSNKEENIKEQVEILAAKFPVYLSDVSIFENALQMIADVGALTGRNTEAEKLTKEIRGKFESFQPKGKKIRAVYLIWKDPYMTAGGDTFISDMMEKAGFENICRDMERYPEIDIDELKQLELEVLFLSSEPYPFKEKHITELQAHLPETKILLADGEMFSWYGSRMLYAHEYFQKLQQQIKA